MQSERFTVVASRCRRKLFVFFFHVVVFQNTSRKSAKMRAARAARLFDITPSLKTSEIKS